MCDITALFFGQEKVNNYIAICNFYQIMTSFLEKNKHSRRSRWRVH